MRTTLEKERKKIRKSRDKERESDSTWKREDGTKGCVRPEGSKADGAGPRRILLVLWPTGRWNPRSRLIAIKVPLGPLAVNILFPRLFSVQGTIGPNAVLPRTPNSAALLSIASTPLPRDPQRASIRNEVNLNTGPYAHPLQFFFPFASFVFLTCSLSLSFSLASSKTMGHRWTTRDASKWSNNHRTCVPAQASLYLKSVYRYAADPPQFSLDPTTYRRGSSSVGVSLSGPLELFSPLLPTLATLCSAPTRLDPRYAAREIRGKRMNETSTDCIR